MKTKIATALSLVGVLGAGSAAALVNTEILDGGSEAASSAVLPAVLPAEPAAAATTSTTQAPTTTQATTTTTMPPVVITLPATPAPAAAPSGMLTTFNVGAAGSVTVDVVDGRAVYVSAQPNAGWALIETEDDDGGDEVEVKFADATTIVEFKVAFVGGQLVPTVESESRTAGTVPSNTTANTVTGNTVTGNTVAQNTVTQNTIDDDHDDDRDDDDRDDDDDHDDD